MIKITLLKYNTNEFSTQINEIITIIFIYKRKIQFFYSKFSRRTNWIIITALNIHYFNYFLLFCYHLLE